MKNKYHLYKIFRIIFLPLFKLIKLKAQKNEK